MRLLKVFGAGLVVVVALFIGVGLFLPNSWDVEEKITMRAPASIIHHRVAHLRSWPEWSPYAHIDAEATFAWRGKDGDLGSQMRWNGPRLGQGALTLVENIEPERVAFEGAIESDAPNAHTAFHIDAKNDGTTVVVWREEGQTPPIVGGYMRSLIEQTLRDHMKRGLEKLKIACEGAAAQRAGGTG